MIPPAHEHRPDRGAPVETVAIICLDDRVARWSSTIVSFVRACDRVVLLAAAAVSAEVHDAYGGFPVEVRTTTLAAAALDLARTARLVAVVHDLAVVTPDAFDRARGMIEDDIRIATVSFFSNNADYLSIPDRNMPQVLAPAGFNEGRITRVLRHDPLLPGPVPVPVPAGAVVVLSGSALASLGGMLESAPTAEYGVIDFALRAARRGMRNVLDAGTFVLRTSAGARLPDPFHDATMHAGLHRAHPVFPLLYEQERDAPDGPLATAIAVARTAIAGLRVLIDGSVLGPYEMGTQVSVLWLIDALCRRDDVREVVVNVPIGAVPAYAQGILGQAKIRIVTNLAQAGHVDVLHRPFQPDEPMPWAQFRAVADRVVVSVLDLIAYENGAYFSSPEAWMEYRATLHQAIRWSDGVVAISEDTAETIRSARMPVATERLRVVHLGADHPLDTSPHGRTPEEVVVRGMAAADFVFVLGASYAHKNRDLAIRAWRELRERGYPQRLIMAGVVVPYGSTRNDEARLGTTDAGRDDVLILPDVSPAERLWLLSHAQLLLYPTSAEGFGLVPFEAAACGTPTLFVQFGPLAELMTVPTTVPDWTPTAFADAMASLLDDPAARRAQLEAITEAGRKLSWAATAEAMVHFYRETLSRPANRSD